MEYVFDVRVEFRCNENMKNMLDELISSNPNYESISHVIRCAIIKLHNQEVKKS